jgi:hypothetical protein
MIRRVAECNEHQSSSISNESMGPQMESTNRRNPNDYWFDATH